MARPRQPASFVAPAPLARAIPTSRKSPRHPHRTPRRAAPSRHPAMLDSQPQPPPPPPPPSEPPVDAITSLQRRRIHLLVTDLSALVRTECPGASTTVDSTLARLSMLSVHLLPAPRDDSSLRAALRTELWNLRRALLPASPSPHLRTAVELARSALLHTGAVRARASDEMTALAAEVALLDELRALRVRERTLYAAAAGLQSGARARLAAAAAALRVDEHRVRGKTALLAAAAAVRAAAAASGRGDVVRVAGGLVDALEASRREDVARRRPAGRVMLVQPRAADIPNFALADATLLRGGQPNRHGLEWLCDYGATDVLDLRGSDAGNCWAGDARLDAAAHGVRFWSVPIEDFCTPSVAQVRGFVRQVDAIREADGVVFVHCKAGIGRTGTMVACWRIAHGVDVDEALGMERLYTEGGGGIRQERFVRDFARLINGETDVRDVEVTPPTRVFPRAEQDAVAQDGLAEARPGEGGEAEVQ